ncbi:hypothetical protein [Gayadomonas joobiniege]|uniref:hypothetical protein n=1 Tax=Gayadomonas joobiniege TaxID=1234606 RepID=UPI00036DF96D|nr:hypothetical protein [Gayadomonas joobiniege]
MYLKLFKPKYTYVCLMSLLLGACGGGGGGGSDSASPNEPEPEPPQPASPIAPSGKDWQYCAKAGETCEFNGQFEVAFGNSGDYSIKTHNDGVLCSSDIFNHITEEDDSYCWAREIEPPVQASILLDATATAQPIIMLGGDMERSHRNFHQAANQEEIIKWLVEDIKFNTWRVSYDKHQEMSPGVKDFSIYDNAIKAMKMIKAINPDMQFFATLESDYNGYGQGNRNNLPTFIYDYEYKNGAGTGSKHFDAQKYALFLADYVEYMEQSGVPLSYLAMSKEYVGVITAERTKEALETLIAELSRRNVAMPKIIDAGTWSISNGIKLIGQYQDLGINQHVYGYSSHDYWSGETKTWQDFATAAGEAGKIAFNDETGHGGGGPILNEVNIGSVLGAYSKKADMYAGGLQGEAIFELWPRGYGEVQTNKYYAKPIFFDKGSDGRRMRSYFIMKTFINSIVDSEYVNTTIESQPELKTMAFKQGDQLSLWIVNTGETDLNAIDIAVQNFNLKSGMQIEQIYWQENTEIRGNQSSISLTSDDLFSADIKARSLTGFMIRADYPLITEIKQDNGTWATGDRLFVKEGDTVAFKATSSIDGDWSWQGPNDFSATTQTIEIANVSSLSAGEYIATFTDENGHSSQISTELQIDCATDPFVSLGYQINDNSPVTGHSDINLAAGDKLRFSPQANGQGQWQWHGPDGFSHSGQNPQLSLIKPKQSGQYQLTFTSEQGCSVQQAYQVTASCSATPLIMPKVQIAGAWSESNQLEYRQGDTFQISANASTAGRWQWTGPNGFSAMEVQQLQFSDAGDAQTGTYTATFTTPAGCQASQTFTTNLVAGECTPAKVTPYFRINQGTWMQTGEASVKVGDTIDIGPQPHGGTWSWSGPDDYASDQRQIQLSKVTLAQAGTYSAIYTPQNGGCPGQVEFKLTVSE